jgi:hypothetical protein
VLSIDSRARQLKQSLLDFVLDAEGDLAIALESFSAERLNRFKKAHAQSAAQTDLIVDGFLIQGCVQGQTPLTLFSDSDTDLTPEDRHLLAQWAQSFTGLFVVIQTLENGRFELQNWLTAKHYTAKAVGLQPQEQVARLQPGEIVLTRIAPIAPSEWMLFSPLILMGKLGKPKLAVAIGNFRQHYSEDLYGDAPELLQEAWRSVEQYHQEWLNFFGDEEIILPGYQANQQLQHFQEEVAQRRLAVANLGSTNSLADLAHEVELSEEEIAREASAAAPMVRPQINLPDTLKKADQVALLTHPQWGQLYLSNYPKIKHLLESEAELTEKNKTLVRQALENIEMNAYLWHRLADRYAVQLERVLKAVLEQPDFSLGTDFDAVLQSFGKSLQPVLPETASVPAHLNSLFQEAVLEVHKTQAPKSKNIPHSHKGFQQK